jgi:hypothetical protein
MQEEHKLHNFMVGSLWDATSNVEINLSYLLTVVFLGFSPYNIFWGPLVDYQFDKTLKTCHC